MSNHEKLIEESKRWQRTTYNSTGGPTMSLVRRLTDALEQSEKELEEWKEDAITAQQNECHHDLNGEVRG